MFRNVTQGLGTGQIIWNDRKMDMIFGTWNVRSLYRAGALGLVTSELDRCRMDLVGVHLSKF